MEVLNDLPSHKQFLFDCVELNSHINGFKSYWDPSLFHVLEPQSNTFLPGASMSEALSRTGSPNSNFLNEVIAQQDLLYQSNTKKPAAVSTVRSLSCHPYIKKCSKRGLLPATNHVLKKELECLLSESLLDEIVYFNGSPVWLDRSLEVSLGHVHAGNEISGVTSSTSIDVKDHLSKSTSSYGDGELSYPYGDSSSRQSFEGGEIAYPYDKSPVDSTSLSVAASSETSTSNRVLGSSEILYSDQLMDLLFDQTSMVENATHSLQTWFEDPFSSTATLQSYPSDEHLINDVKKEDLVVNDEGENVSHGYDGSKAAHSQGFLARTECQQGNDSILIASNEGNEAPEHPRIDFEENFVQLHNIVQEGKFSNQGSAPSDCTQFCLPRPMSGPFYGNTTMQKLHTTLDGYNTYSATYNSSAAENKPQSKYAEQLIGMYETVSAKSCSSYISENPQTFKSVKSEICVGKTREVGANFSQSGVRLKNDYTEFGLVHLLMAGAEAVARRDMDLASVILVRLKDMVSCSGNTMQRVVAYFIQGLERQIEGTKRVDNAGNIKSQGDILAAFQILHEIFPYIKFGHFTANQAILEAVQGANRVHIIDFEIMEGIQWPAFMQALVSRKGGPPELHITALCRAQWVHGLAMVQKTGKRLSEFASALDIPFTFSLLKIDNDEGFNANKLKLVGGEALVVNCMVHLPHMPRRTKAAVTSFLQGLQKLSPTIITLVEEELSCSTTAVASYFFEALYHFHAICDSLEACLPVEVEARMLVERVFLAPRIESAVAMWSRTMSSGSLSTMEVSDKYKWSTVMHSAGFKLLPLSFQNQSQAKLLLGLHKDGFKLEERSHYLVLGWQSKPLFSASVWIQ